MSTNIFLSALAILLLVLSCKEEAGFSADVRITGIPEGTKIMLQELSTGTFIDSAIVKSSRFHFSGRLTEIPGELRIISSMEEIKKGQFYYTDLLIKNEKITIEADVSEMPNHVTSTGSKTQKEAEAYRKQLHKWNLKIDSLKKILGSEILNDGEKALISAQISYTQHSKDKWDSQYIKDNFDSYIALLTYSYRRDFSSETLDSLYDGLSGELKESRYGRAIRTQIDFPPPRVGDTLHDIDLADSTGKRIKLSEIEDKYILLQFAGSGCYGSNQSIQHMKEIFPSYSDSVTFVSSFFESKDTYEKYVRQQGIPWMTSLLSDGKFSEPTIKYGVVGTPTFYLISPEKKIVATWFGYEEKVIENHIDKELRNKNAL